MTREIHLTPYLCVAGAARAVDWYTDVLGAAVVVEPVVMDDGRIGHVELAVGGPDGARWMMSDEFEGAGVAGPDRGRGAAVTLHLGMAAADDVDELAARVVAAGVALDRGPATAERAGRVAVFRDPFGHRWFLNAPA